VHPLVSPFWSGWPGLIRDGLSGSSATRDGTASVFPRCCITSARLPDHVRDRPTPLL
jgi:hypothetical protein